MRSSSGSSIDTVVQFLVNQGVLTEDNCSKLASVITSLQGFGLPGGMGASVGRKRGPASSGGGKRGRRATFEATKEELSRLRDSGMTVKAIAEKYGVSMPTVNLHLKKHGLTTPRGSSKNGRKKGGK